MQATIRPATSADDFAALGRLFRAYAAELGVDLRFQSFDKELADIKGFYVLTLIAGPPEAPSGCVALKRLSPERCEMKRLYVAPSARADGLGKRLAEAVIDEARARGYAEMVLDTLGRLERAVAMYERMGFERIPAYYPNPEVDVVYMRLAL